MNMIRQFILFIRITYLESYGFYNELSYKAKRDRHISRIDQYTVIIVKHFSVVNDDHIRLFM